MNTDKEVKNRLIKLKSKFGTWGAVGKHLGLTGALVWKIANGQCQSSRKARAAFGLRKEEVDRLAARVSVEQGAAIRECLQNKFGFESITEFWLDFFMEEIMRQETDQ